MASGPKSGSAAELGRDNQSRAKIGSASAHGPLLGHRHSTGGQSQEQGQLEPPTTKTLPGIDAPSFTGYFTSLGRSHWKNSSPAVPGEFTAATPRPSSFQDRPRTQSPDNYRRSTSSSKLKWLTGVPEDSEMSVEQGVVGSGSGDNTGHRFYGSAGDGYSGATSMSADEMSEDEEEAFLDEELEKEGLYRGNYRNLMLLYSFVPLTTLLAFIVLALLPIFTFRGTSTSPFPYPPYLPFPIPEILVAAALWSLSYLLRDALYSISQFLTSTLPFPNQRYPSFIPFLTFILSSVAQNTSTLLFRQLAVPILLVPFYSTERFKQVDQSSDLNEHHFPTWQDGAFRRIWWIALGWAAVEAVVGIRQGYENIGLYKDVLVGVHKTVGKETSPAQVAASSDQPASGGRSKDAMSRTFGTDSSITPTQNDWRGRSTPLDGENVRISVDLSRRREHSSSISSTTSGPAYEDLRGSAVLGERQPLLPLNRPGTVEGVSLIRRSTDESHRLLAENEVERDLDELMRLKTREELEEVYGIPVIRIPVFISCLHRINSILSSLGATMILTAAYMRSSFAYFPPPGSPPAWYIQYFAPVLLVSLSPSSSIAHAAKPSNHALTIAFLLLLLLQTVLSLMHTPWILPRIGIHTYVYVNLLIWLGVFFVALGLWEVLT